MLALQNTILAHCFINTLPFQIDSTTNSYISTHYNTNFQYVFWMTAVIRQPDIKNGRVYSNWALIYILHTFHVSVFIFCRYEYCCKTNFCQCKNKIFQVELGKINDSDSPSLRSTQATIQWVPGFFCRGQVARVSSWPLTFI
jgi:hypothetical protein